MTRLLAVQGDITTLVVDVIVNAANSGLVPGGGVDGAIHRVGGPAIREETRRISQRIGSLATGQAVITGAGELPARNVIHTVGPIWHEVTPAEGIELLASCYRESLELAVEHDCRTIAFPGISTGVYGFPMELACHTAVGTVRSWIGTGPAMIDEVTFVSFDGVSHGLYLAAVG